MYCYLEKWDHTKREVEIPDGTKEIAGVIISGDEILVYPCFCDPERFNRIDDYFEGAFNRIDNYFEGAFCRVWKDGEWVDKDDYVEIETEED